MFPRGATPGAIVIRHVRVFDGIRVLEADSVLVRDGVIIDVGWGLRPRAMPRSSTGPVARCCPG